MSENNLENYLGENGEYFPNTPVELFRGKIPGQVIDYCARYNRKTLSRMHYTLRGIFQGLTSPNKSVVESAEEILEELVLDKRDFNAVFVVVSDFLGEEYIKNQFFEEFQRPPQGENLMQENNDC